MNKYFEHWIDVVSVSALSLIKIDQVERAFVFSFLVYLPNQVLKIEVSHQISEMRGLLPNDYFFEERFNQKKVKPVGTVEYDNFKNEYNRLLQTIHFEKLPTDSLEKAVLFEKMLAQR